VCVVARYEREEVFYALNVTVKNATLEDSLWQFVKGELLEGDNAYFCEKCNTKVLTPLLRGGTTHSAPAPPFSTPSRPRSL